ncbi:uncharacterized protein LOC121596758 isoform X4 [Anopheles merus]|uniref:uncharacterized protein LOC121596758 isoform X4 n=1 Tax=Anopheles merus TaxID=30066 RepID=UPI001BE41123|nr:uncharacterized protein LOC121596758 isoform X4 [Anopheles merus]
MPYKGLHSSRAPRFRRSAKTFRRPAQGCGESNAPEQQNDGLQPSGTAVQSPTLGTDLDSRPPVPSTSGTPSAGSSVDPCHEAVDDADSDSESEGEQMKLHVPPSAQETSFPLAAAQDPFMSLAFASSDEYFSNTLGQLPSLSRTYRDSKQPWMVITDKPQGPLLDDGDKNWMWKQYDELSTSGTVSPTLGTVELAQEMVEATSDTIKPEMVECKSEMVDDTLEIVEPTVEPMSETIETEMGKPESEMFDDTSEIVEPTVEPMSENIEPELAMSESEMFGDASEIVEPMPEPLETESMSEPLETCESTVEPMSETIETEMGKPESEMFDDTSEIVEPTVEPMSENIEPGMVECKSEMVEHTPEIVDHTVEPMAEIAEPKLEMFEAKLETVEPTQGTVQSTLRTVSSASCLVESKFDSTYIPPPWTGFSELGTDLLTSGTVPPPPWLTVNELCDDVISVHGSDSETDTTGKLPLKELMELDDPLQVPEPSQSMVTTRSKSAVRKCKTSSTRTVCEDVISVHGSDSETDTTGKLPLKELMELDDPPQVPEPSQSMVTTRSKSAVRKCKTSSTRTVCDDVISVHGSDSETDTTGKLPLKELMELDDPPQVPEPSQSMVTTRSKSVAAVPSKTTRKFKTSSTRTANQPAGPIQLSEAGRVRRLPPPSAKQRFQAKLARERSLCRSPPLPRRRRIEVVLPLPPPSDEEESEAEDEGQSKP